MARLVQTKGKIFWQVPPRISKHNCDAKLYPRNFSRSFSHRYVPVKLAHKLFEPECGSIDRVSPIIFLHGITSSKESWDNLPQIIADKTKRKAYSFDARNHGDSGWSDAFDFDLNAQDLLYFMDSIGAPRAIIVGHSMGGLTAYKAALKEPERIEKLFVEEMFVKKVPQAFMDDALVYMNVWKEMGEFIPRGVDKAEADNFITQYVLQKTQPHAVQGSHRESRFDISYPLKEDPSGRFVFKANLKVILEKMKNADAMMVETEGIYEGPAYFIYGTKSPYQVGKEKHHILKHFPKAVFFPFEGARHYVHKEFPEKFTATVLKYLV